MDTTAYRADLHCHSTFSDGTLSPATLAARASAHGVTLWSLTDHDEIGGQREALAGARDAGLHYLTGVEISVSFARHTIHIVGLGFDPEHPALVQGLARIRAQRTPRAQEMASQLAQVGIEGAYEGALRYVENPALISRTHFARFLVERGICPDTHAVFRHYLVEGKPGYVPQQWASLQEAVQWIREAGGVAAIAHPARYQLDPTLEGVLLDQFKLYGGQAVEVTTGSHTPAEYSIWAAKARDYGLAASCGSDFHGPGESPIDLGHLPPLPRGLTPVWDLLREHIHTH